MLNNSGKSIINDYWQIETLKMVNWGVYDGGDPPHAVEFSKGEEGSLTMVTGNSGTGKSTILDALITLLFKSGRQMNQASSQGQEKDKRSIYSYVRGYINETEDPDTGRNIVSYFRGTADDGTKLPVWSAITLTLCNANAGRLTLAGFFYVQAGETKNAAKVWVLSDGAIDPRSAERVADHAFSPKRIREVYTDALVVSDNKEDMRRKYHDIVGIDERTENLLYRILTGSAESDVTKIFRNIVLDRPRTIEMAASLVALYDQSRETIDSWEGKVKKQQAFDRLRKLNGKYDEARLAAVPYGTIGTESESAGELDGIRRWHAKRFVGMMDRRIEALKSAHLRTESDISRLEGDFELSGKKYEQAQKAFNAAGGATLDELDAEINSAATALSAKEGNVKRLGALFAEIEAEVPDSEDAWNRRLSDLWENDASAPIELAQLESKIDTLQTELLPARSSLADARDDLQRAQRLRTRVTARMEGARQAVSQATSIAADRLRYACEMFDMRDGYADWRGAANLALLDLADCLIVDEADRQAFLRGIEVLPADSIGHRCRYRFVDPQAYRLLDNDDPSRLSGRIKLKHGSFAAFLSNAISSDDRDCLCVDDAFDETTSCRQLKSDGMLRDSHGGEHGYESAPSIIGFVDEAELERLNDCVAELAKKASGLMDALTKAHAEKKVIEAKRRIYAQISDMPFSDVDIATAKFQLESLKAQKESLAANRELDQLREALDAADRERLDAHERLRTAQTLLSDTKSSVKAYSACRDALEVKVERRRDLLDPADETVGILEQVYRTRTDEAGLPQREDAEGLEAYADECTEAFIDAFRDKAGAIQATAAAACRAVEREMVSCKEIFGAATPELNHVGTDIRDISAYLSIDLSGSEQALIDMFAQNLPKINLAFKNFSECEREYEDDVLDAFATINGILARYPFRADGAALEIKPTFKRNTSSYRAVREMVKSVVADEYDNASSYRSMPLEDLKRKLDEIGTVVDFLRPDKMGNPSKVVDSRQRLNVKVTVGEGDNLEVINAAASMNGGYREKVKAFILSVALFYTLKSSADSRPLFAPILFDEAFIKSDMDTTQTAIKAMLGFGFQLFISCPDGKQASILPMTDTAWFVTRKNLMQPACLNKAVRVHEMMGE
ncbi:ATP-binding protein [Collinsella sp. AF38-3AC]|uniref:ATP-binding protein n=1 Tax=Collinsella sp. AF38-3AC TaxID=2292015 RepID=UPI000E5574BB|nr:ATP-binding protein [Collinsella sp. AF38-3AC]RHL25390.1 hypothetical protein DW029_02860 [Collinsella sp. AF38-3AC]